MIPRVLLGQVEQPGSRVGEFRFQRTGEIHGLSLPG